MTAVQLDAQGQCTIRQIVLTPPHDLRTITGTLAELTAQAAQEQGRLDYIRADLTDRGELLEPMAALRAVYPNILELRRLYALRPQVEDGVLGQLRPEETSPEELFAQFYQQMTGEDWPKAYQKIVQGVLERLLKERG